MKFQRRLEAAEKRMTFAAQHVRDAIEAMLLDAGKTLSKAHPECDMHISSTGRVEFLLTHNYRTLDFSTKDYEIIWCVRNTYDRIRAAWGVIALPQRIWIFQEGKLAVQSTEREHK